MNLFDNYYNLVLEAHAGENASNAERDEARGQAYEDLFVQLCKQNKLKCKQADQYEETVLHIDFKVLDKGEPAWGDRPENAGKVAKNKSCYVEVKNDKRLIGTDNLLLEFVGNKGHKGWMYGEANYIAFYNTSRGGFDMVKRHPLLKEIESLGLFSKRGEGRGVELFHTSNKEAVKYTDIKEDAVLIPNKEAVFYTRRRFGNFDMTLYVPAEIVMKHKTFEINPVR